MKLLVILYRFESKGTFLKGLLNRNMYIYFTYLYHFNSLIMKKKIVIAGGSGFLGHYLIHHFFDKGYDVVVLTRSTDQMLLPNVKWIQWDGKTIGDWVLQVDDADIWINLTGKSVNCRYNSHNKEVILRSRVDSTLVLHQALKIQKNPPRLWLNASSATIYQHELVKDMDEKEGIIGEGFSVEVCKAWETAFFDTETPQTRKVALRAAMVFGNYTGLFTLLKRIVKLGLGGTQGNGRQLVSWIHHKDFINAVQFIVDHEGVVGPVNVSSPNPIPNKAFMKALRNSLNVSLGLPAYKWMLYIGAFFMRTEPELLLKSRRVIPNLLLDKGFTFEFPIIENALMDLSAN